MPLGAFHPPDPLGEVPWLRRGWLILGATFCRHAAVCRHPLSIDIVPGVVAASLYELDSSHSRNRV